MGGDAEYCDSFCPDRPKLDSDTNMQYLVSFILDSPDTYCQNYECPRNSSGDIDINCFDTSEVKSMAFAFQARTEFNSPLNCWKTSSVVNMDGMFPNVQSFNQDISNWDVSNVASMFWMFHVAEQF